MTRIFVCFLSCVSLGVFGSAAAAAPEDAVVKVFASVRFPNPVQPWVKAQASPGSGSGVVIDGKWILTNAHVVAYGTEIYVKDRLTSDKIEATVYAVNFDVDLALLSVADAKFLANRPSLPRAAQLPRVQERVVVYGYPVGGNDLMITKGEVSRIEYGAGPYRRGIGPIVQISAAVNAGNSGGPALVDDKMVGLVVSRLQTAQNIGSIIPNEEIDLFLNKVKRGQPQGKPILVTPVTWQTLENQALRRKFKLDPAVRGVLLHPPSRADLKYPLLAYDVLTKIGDFPVDNLGQVQLKNGLRAPFLYLVPQLTRDGSVSVTILRQGKEITAMLPTTTQDNRVLGTYQGEPLSYFIHGPLVFAQAKSEDLTIYAQMNRTLQYDNSPLVMRWEDTVRFPGEELVVVSSRLLPHASSKGYLDPVGKVVRDVNGTSIKNLRHLVETIRDAKEEFLTIRFADHFSEVLVFDRKELERATEEILEDNGIAITRRGSADMLKVWKAAQGG